MLKRIAGHGMGKDRHDRVEITVVTCGIPTYQQEGLDWHVGTEKVPL